MVYGVIMAGWSSNSKYPFLAALRSAAQMVSYEVSIGFVIITVLLCVGSLNLTDIVEAQRNHGVASFIGLPWLTVLNWYWLPLLPMFVIFFISALAETNRPPFDLVEAEFGTGRRLHGGIRLDAVHDVHARRIRGHRHDVRHGHHSVPRRLAAAVPGGAVHLDPGSGLVRAQGALVFFMFAMVKAFVPRYRYDQLMRLGWKVFLPISLAMVAIVAGVLTIVRG